MGPVVLSGHWTWLGYNFVNDTATNLALADHLAQHGHRRRVWRAVDAAVGRQHARSAQGYPLGAHGLLAALEWLVPAPVEAVYQPFIASVAAFAAMALAWLATQRCGVRGGRGGGGRGLLAIGANLTYQCALQGSFKEIA